MKTALYILISSCLLVTFTFAQDFSYLQVRCDVNGNPVGDPNCPPQGVCPCSADYATCPQLVAGCYQTQQNPTPIRFNQSLPQYLTVNQSIDDYVVYDSPNGTKPVGFYNGLSSPFGGAGSTPFFACVIPDLPEGLNFSTVYFPQSNVIGYHLVGTPTQPIPATTYSFVVKTEFPSNQILLFKANFGVKYAPCSGSSSTSTASSTSSGSTSTSGSSSTSGLLSGACSGDGYERCANSEVYQTCSHGVWGPAQDCNANLQCKPSGNYIYCQ